LFDIYEFFRDMLFWHWVSNFFVHCLLD
jgi:hypothetical protein